MLKKINVIDLQVGMHLHKLCGSWMQHPFWRTKFVITDPADIKAVYDSGIKEVWIDSAKGTDVVTEDSASLPGIPMEPGLTLSVPAEAAVVAPTSMKDELTRAARICAAGKEVVVSMFQEVRMGKAISTVVAGELVEEIASSVMRNPGALISLSRLKTADDYTYMHSVAVCALMVATGRQLGMEEQELRMAGLAGLLHDIGKALMPMDILNKPGKLTDEEFAIIKKHPEEGHRLLLEGGMVGEIACDVCLRHHEKVDGSGYPGRLKDEQISLYAKMGAVCDVYDAITSNRPYKAGWDPAEAVRRMVEWSGGHFDTKVFRAFVKSVGIYPVGSLVHLNSGRLGVIVEQSEKSLLAPKVKVFFSTKSDLRIPPEVIDLSSPAVRDKVAAIEEAAKWSFPDLNELWKA